MSPRALTLSAILLLALGACDSAQEPVEKAGKAASEALKRLMKRVRKRWRR